MSEEDNLVPFPSDFSSLSMVDGKLVVEWEIASGMPFPYMGSGLWSSGTEKPPIRVWIVCCGFTAETMKTLDIMYAVVKLDEKSQSIVDSEHERFRKEVGYSCDYGPLYNTAPPQAYYDGNDRLLVRYCVNYLLTDLKCESVIGKIAHSQIKNPFPHSPL
jgi:hypothetical protein